MQLDYFLLCLQSDHSSFPLSDSCAKDIFYLSGSVFKCDGGSILDYHIHILGILVFLIEFVTALPYFYSILLLDHLTINTPTSIFIIIGYNLLMVLPSIVLLGINVLFKDKLQQILEKIKTKLNEAPASSLLVAVGVVGAVFFNIGIRGILN